MTERRVALPFADRQEAALLLAERVAQAGLPADTLVLGIARGGVPIAAAIARRLGAALDVVVAHKLGAPGEPELAVGAVTASGSWFREPWAEMTGADDAYLRAERDRQLERAREREARIRRSRPAASMTGRTVLIVDDGIATGATVRAAVMAAREGGASRVVVAAPVAAPSTVDELRALADEVVTLAEPDPFMAVGLWYLRFDEVTDDDVARALDTASAAPKDAGQVAR